MKININSPFPITLSQVRAAIKQGIPDGEKITVKKIKEKK